MRGGLLVVWRRTSRGLDLCFKIGQCFQIGQWLAKANGSLGVVPKEFFPHDGTFVIVPIDDDESALAPAPWSW